MKKLDPKEPTKEEREEHEKTHLPYRNWCRHCVRGQGKEEPCRRSTSDDPNVPEIHMDFMFMGNEGGARTLAMLVVKERSTKAVMACVTPAKSSGEFLGKRVLAFMREWGCELEAVTVKTDNEPSLLQVVETVARLRAAKGGIKMAARATESLNAPCKQSKAWCGQ